MPDYFQRQRSPVMCWDDKLIASQRVLILGAGGIGSGVAMLLARMGVARITLVDYDTVDPTNLNRQLLFTTQHAAAGTRKVDAAAETLRSLHAMPRTEIVALHMNALTNWPKIVEMIADSTFVVQGIDQGGCFDLATRAACQKYRIPVIEAESFSHRASSTYYPFHRYYDSSSTSSSSNCESKEGQSSSSSSSSYASPQVQPILVSPDYSAIVDASAKGGMDAVLALSPQVAEGYSQTPFYTCYACAANQSSYPTSLFRWMTIPELTDTQGNEAEGIPAGLAATMGAAFLPADAKGPFSTGVAGSHVLVCTLACTNAVYLWAQDISRAGAVLLEPLVVNFSGVAVPISTNPPNDYLTPPAAEASSYCRACGGGGGGGGNGSRNSGGSGDSEGSEGGATPLSCTPEGLRNLAFGSEPVVFTSVPADVRIYCGPGGPHESLQLKGNPFLPSHGRFTLDSILQQFEQQSVAATPSTSNHTTTSMSQKNAANVPLAHIGGPIDPAAVLPMPRLDAVPGTTNIWTACVPAPDLDSKAYLSAPLNPTAVEGGHFSSPVLKYGIIKSLKGDIHGIRSGARSAILNSDSLNPASPPLRLKGCGNLVVMDPALNTFPFPGFPLRDITVSGLQDEVGQAADMVRAFRGPEAMTVEKMQEVRGCAFEHTALREAVMTARVAAVLSKEGGENVVCGNYPLAVTKYGAFAEEAGTESAIIDKYCGVHVTLGDKRLGSHVLPGLEALLPYLVVKTAAAAAAGSPTTTAIDSSSSIENNTTPFKRLLASATSQLNASVPGVQRLQASNLYDRRTVAVSGKVGFVPADLTMPTTTTTATSTATSATTATATSITTPTTTTASWPAAQDVEFLASAAVQAALRIHPHWRPLWSATVAALMKVLGTEGCGVTSSSCGNGGILAYTFRRLGAEVGRTIRLLQAADISWGSFTDMCPPVEDHCNAHINNYVVVASTLAAGGPSPSLVPEIYSSGGNGSGSGNASVGTTTPVSTSSAPTKPEFSLLKTADGFSQFLAPVDFDMAFLRSEFRQTSFWCPEDRGKPDDETCSSWAQTGGIEPSRMFASLAGTSANTGVGARLSVEELAKSVAKAKSIVSAANAASIGDTDEVNSTEILLCGLTDTMLSAYSKQVSGTDSAFAASITGTERERAELAARLLLRLACMITDGCNS